MIPPGEIMLDDLAHLPLWVGWREEQKDGRLTKVPYDPITGELAKSNNPATWATRAEAEAWAIANKGGGAGIMFSRLNGAGCLSGVDLDTCRDPNTETFQSWAQEVIDRFATYTEISPSGTGAKLFFTHAVADLPTVERVFDGKGGRTFKNGGGEHCPAIEIYRTGRYFTVTGESIGPTDILRQVPIDDLEWLVRDAGPRFAHKESQKGGSGKDQSRSGKAFRKGAALKTAGYSYDAMRDALLADEDAEIREWARTKGLADDEREMRRIYENADILSPQFSEDRLALRFTERYGINLRYVAAWGKWLAWTGTHWEIENTLAVFDMARKICREAAAGCNKPSMAKAIAKASTVAAVETLSRSDRRVAATIKQWNADQSFFNMERLK